MAKDFENDTKLEELFKSSVAPEIDNAQEELDMPSFEIDLDAVNSESEKKAEEIIQKLSDYYFDEKYIKEHPYIPNKIKQEVDSVRRLLKMLSINENAQDTLIRAITLGCQKGSLYTSLTTLQNTMLSIQTKLDESVEKLEDIFQTMQENCEETFEDKEKESSDGGLRVRGSKEFIRAILEAKNGEIFKKNSALGKHKDVTEAAAE